MLKIKNKTKWIILLYFFIILGLIAVSSLLFHWNHTSSSNKTPQTAIFIFDEQTLEQTYKNGMVNLDISEITSYATLEKDIYHNIVNQGMIFLIITSVFIGVTTLVLYNILKRQNNQQLQDIITHMCSVDDSSFLQSNSALSKGYLELEKHFEEKLKSYKKLSSYLSHEQKNSIALLRAKLEYYKHREYLNQLDELSSSIDDILTLSDFDDTEMLMETDCILICAETCDMYRKLGHHIDFYFNEDDCRILAKPRWIIRAVSNILNNAVKYGNNLPIVLTVTREQDTVIITLIDHGYGIPEEEQSKIFQNHYRVKDLQKDGYGIGLSLVSHVCDLCGGFVWVDSKLGEGSTFYLSFPAFELL